MAVDESHGIDSRYILLADDDDDNCEGSHGDKNSAWVQNQASNNSVKRSPSPPSLVSISVFSVLLISFLALFTSCIQLASIYYIQHITPDSAMTVATVSSLRRPSQYFGLDRLPDAKLVVAMQRIIANQLPLPSPSAPVSFVLAPLPNAKVGGPWRIHRINSAYPQLAFPEDGWLFLTEWDSAIVQFQRPLGSSEQSQCAFRGSFPERRELQNRLLTLEGEPVRIEFWTVHSPPPATTYSKAKAEGQLTWDTRPERTTHLGSLDAIFGHNATTKAFPCPCDVREQWWVELRCIGEGCRVEYVEESVEPELDITLVYV